jgi:hypothetical protein
MVYKKKLNKRVPIKRLMELYSEEKVPSVRKTYKDNKDWYQHIPNNNDDELRNLMANILNIPITKIVSCILHVIQGNVDRHNDFMSKVVYLIPLRFTKTCIFYDDDNQLHFEKGFAYEFNDFNYHGIHNPNRAKILVISVDTKP